MSRVEKASSIGRAKICLPSSDMPAHGLKFRFDSKWIRTTDLVLVTLIFIHPNFFAGSTIFMVLGNVSLELGLPIEKVMESGHGLAFITYPIAIGKFAYPWARPYLAVLFFIMLGILGIGSVNGLIKCLTSVLYRGKSNKIKIGVTAIVCSLGFMVGTIYLTPVSIYKFIFFAQIVYSKVIVYYI